MNTDKNMMNFNPSSSQPSAPSAVPPRPIKAENVDLTQVIIGAAMTRIQSSQRIRLTSLKILKLSTRLMGKN
jgi:hypothetical protein